MDSGFGDLSEFLQNGGRGFREFWVELEGHLLVCFFLFPRI
jgi:hypothetical protein